MLASTSLGKLSGSRRACQLVARSAIAPFWASDITRSRHDVSAKTRPPTIRDS